MFVKPPGPRHTATELPDGLVIRIPARRNIFMLTFLSFWLCGWLMGEIAVPFTFFKAGKDPGATAFTLVWLGMWTLGGGFAIYTWLWQVKGCEVVTVSPSAFSIQRAVFGLGRTRHYDLTQIRALRLSQQTYNPFDFRSSMAVWGMGGGMISFDYGYKTFRFGAGIDEAEARTVLQAITARQPQLAHEETAPLRVS